ncbi:hypothetical protein SAMN05216463_11171 [Xylanibacter ruminicola]|uniref:Uncharacterized protein n=1 Tax=Xylanibacter ruminicola TaxID=839 RepID=A0A1M6V1I5_XYLRU|nr:hypothetical protein SAMN05216463_11171 [Xylanibacter ruminicola]
MKKDNTPIDGTAYTLAIFIDGLVCFGTFCLL